MSDDVISKDELWEVVQGLRCKSCPNPAVWLLPEDGWIDPLCNSHGRNEPGVLRIRKPKPTKEEASQALIEAALAFRAAANAAHVPGWADLCEAVLDYREATS